MQTHTHTHGFICVRCLSQVLQQDIKDLNAELVTVKDDMTKLKAVLYGKFGKNINL